MKKFFLPIALIGFSHVSFAQNVGVDVAAPQQKLDVAGAIKVGSTTTGAAGSLRWTGTAFQFHDGTQWITLNANTDDQVLDVIQLNGTDLEISVENDGQATHSIDLSSFLDNTDNQAFDQVTINGSNQLLLSIAGDGQPTHVLDLTGYLDNTDNQQFDVVQLVGTNLQLSLQNDGLATHVVDLSSLAVDTDDQTIDVFSLTGNTMNISLEDDGQVTRTLDLSQFMDNTDDQRFDVINITSDELRLSLEADGQATHVLDLSPYKDNTDDQRFDVVQLSGNSLQLSLENDGQATHSIDLSGFADNTDNQQIDVLSLAGNTLNISLEDDGVANETLDLSQFMDNTDDQRVTTFNLSGTTLQLQVESDAGGLQSVNLDPLKRSLVDADGDTKVEVEATADEDQIRLSTAGGEAVRINATQQVGIGLSTGIQNKLVVNGSNTDTRATLGLRGGNGQNTFADGAQVAFGYDGDDSYQHFIHTRHNSSGGSTNNSIDFYVSDGTQYNTVTSGSTHVMSLNSGNVGVGTTAPDQKLHVAGTGRFTDHLYIGLDNTTDNDIYLSDRLIDWDNIAYYIDPAGISRMNEVEADDGSATDPSFTFTGDQNTGMFQPANNQLAFTLNGSEAVRILTSGNVGIGNAVGGQKLHVTGTARISALNQGSNSVVMADANGDLFSSTSLVGSGLGDNLGNHSATTNLDLNNFNVTEVNSLSIADVGDQEGILWAGSAAKIFVSPLNSGNSDGYLRLINDGGIVFEPGAEDTEVMTLSSTGNVGIGTTSPAASLDVRPNGGTAAFQISSSGDSYPRIYMGGTDANVAFVMNRLTTSATQYFGEDADSGGFQFRGTGTTRIGSLGGGGTRLVRTDNSGNLSTVNTLVGTGLGDNLGNHTATTNITMTDFNILDAGDIEVNRLFDGDGGDNIEVHDHFMMRDNMNLRLGNGSDLRMWHNGTNHYIRDYVHAGGNIYFQGEDSNGTNEALAYFYSNGAAGFVRLYQNGSERLETTSTGIQINNANSIRSQPSGDYGSIQVDGGGKGNYEGYSIEGRYVFMSDDDNTMGLYNDVNNRWVMLYERNDRLDFFDPDVADNAVALRIDNTNILSWRDINMQDNDIVDANDIQANRWFDPEDTEVQIADDLRMLDNDIWDVGRMTVNTIYSEDAESGVTLGANTVWLWDDIAVNISSNGSAQDFYVRGDDSRTTLRTQSSNHGQLGRLQNYWLRTYTNQIYRNSELALSDKRTKQNIRKLSSSESLDKVLQLQGVEYDLSKNHPFYPPEGTVTSNVDRKALTDNLGFLAQDLQEVVPEMVVHDEQSGYLTVINYEQLFPVIVEAMKEQQRQIDELKKQVETLSPQQDR